ncbi:hypothetical protein BJ912DRAFT_867326, partial [Pholiota molesta]
SRSSDGGNFKTTMYQQAAGHITHLYERGIAKTVKACRNKWTMFKKLYCVIRAIQSVSGWVWDNKMGASINADTASSWDDYVKKHPGAKQFRNKGWKHFAQVALNMPSTSMGANIFYPTAEAFTPNDAFASPDPPSPSQLASELEDMEGLDDIEVCI